MKLEQTLYTFKAADAMPGAWRYYLKTCGLEEKPDSPKHARMLARSTAVLDTVLPQLNLRAVTAELPGNCLDGETLDAYGTRFVCRAFARLTPSRVRAVYPYVLTAGDIFMDTENVSDQLFADIWGTSFTDAGIELLEDRLEKLNPGLTLSSSFGPGFFGMDISMMQRFFEALDPGAIGVTLRSSSLLLPLKSCAGFFISLLDEWSLPTRDCESCLGSAGGCRFCANYRPPSV